MFLDAQKKMAFVDCESLDLETWKMKMKNSKQRKIHLSKRECFIREIYYSEEREKIVASISWGKKDILTPHAIPMLSNVFYIASLAQCSKFMC